MSDLDNSMRNDDKLPDEGIVNKSDGMKKIDNFWYYHKWKVIISLFVAVVIIVCTLQMCESDKIDTYVLYTGSYSMLDSSERNGMKEAFESVLPYDLNNDGKNQVEIISHYFLNTEEIESLRAVTDEKGSKVYSPDITFNQNELKQFDSLIMAGEYSVCILSPFLFERVKEAGGFVKLSDLFDEMPSTAIDDYGIKLSETEFAKYFEAFMVLPDDSVLCLRTPSTWLGGNTKSSKEYQLAVDFFKSMVEFIPSN